MSHTCEDHGHYCSVCEEDRIEEKYRHRVREKVASWNGNLSPFEIYDHLKELKEDGEIEELRDSIHEFAQFFTNEEGQRWARDFAYHFEIEIGDNHE